MKRLWYLIATISALMLGLGASQLLIRSSSGAGTSPTLPARAASASGAGTLPTLPGRAASSSEAATSLTLPVRAAFYYPWFPNAWIQAGINPFTHYDPVAGFYDSSSVAIETTHIREMTQAGIQAGISSWWGQGDVTDTNFGKLLQATDGIGSGFKWAIYYEPEGTGNPTATQVQADLAYISSRYAADPAYLRIGGKPVIFVYNANDRTCAIVDKWRAANTQGFYVNLKVFAGFRTCANQPDSWHQYAPAAAESREAGFSFTISPGFWKANEVRPRLARDPARWASNVAHQVAAHDPWQLITTFNEWGEGTAVEPATEFGTTYLSALGAGIR